jgi:hypothetical protein
VEIGFAVLASVTTDNAAFGNLLLYSVVEVEDISRERIASIFRIED